MRKRLYYLLDEVPKKRLTTIVAGAGYGKTTLIAQAARYLNLDAVWYRLDRSDQDFITFLSYLTAGIRNYFPEVGIETFRRIEEAQVLPREREAILAVFLSEIENLVKKDLIIVFDDYHLVQESHEIKETMRFFLDHLPPPVHLIIVSRADPMVPLSRLRALREVLDIREEDLAFTVPEVEELYLQLFGISFQNESIKILHQKTDGWVAGLILFYHSVREKTPEEIQDLLLRLKGSHRIISSYLEENVYNLQPDNIREFLIKTSILSQINPEFCNQFLRIDNSKDILTGLEGNHLFTFPYDEQGERYYYHHLFQDFLKTKLDDELDRKAIHNLNKEAAVLWERQGNDEEALRHYLEAEEFEMACRLFTKLGRKLIREGRLKLTNSYLKKIPDRYVDREPWIQFTRACILEFSGNLQEAIDAYKKANRVFHEKRSSRGIGMCLNALGYNYYLTGDFLRAEKKLKELFKQTEGDPHLSINTIGHLIFILSHLGKMADADRYFRKGMSLLHGLREEDLLARLHLFQGFRYGCSGDFIEALKSGKRAEEIFQNLGRNQFLALDYHLISWSHYHLGLFSQGMENAMKGLDLVKERGFRDISHGWLLIDACLNSTELGRIPEAIHYGKEGLKICQDLGSRWSQAWACNALQGAYEKLGDLIPAENCGRSALEVIEGLALPLDAGYFKGSLARLLLERGQWEETGKLLEDAEKSLQEAKLCMSRITLWYARFYWEQEQKKAALDKLFTALQLSEANHYDVWVIAEKHWIIPLLVEAFGQGNMQAYLQQILDQIGPSATKALVRLQEGKNDETKKAASEILQKLRNAPPPGLRVYCLGKFRAFRGDEEIPTERWKSKNAKTLFKFLLYKRTRGYVTRDILMELLWPEKDPKKTAKRLHVALTSLRKTLEPEIVRGTPSSYLLREGGAYTLYLGHDGWADVDEFMHELKLAKKENDPERSILHHLNAEALYHGDFLEEDIYSEWCADERERLRDEYMDLLEKIMKYFETKGDYLRCIEYSKKYLRVDKSAENIYQHLMRYYSLMDNRAMVSKTFERCKENILKELDSPLSKETEELYQKLVSI